MKFHRSLLLYLTLPPTPQTSALTCKDQITVPPGTSVTCTASPLITRSCRATKPACATIWPSRSCKWRQKHGWTRTSGLMPGNQCRTSHVHPQRKNRSSQGEQWPRQEVLSVAFNDLGTGFDVCPVHAICRKLEGVIATMQALLQSVAYMG